MCVLQVPRRAHGEPGSAVSALPRGRASASLPCPATLCPVRGIALPVAPRGAQPQTLSMQFKLKDGLPCYSHSRLNSRARCDSEAVSVRFDGRLQGLEWEMRTLFSSVADSSQLEEFPLSVGRRLIKM